MSIRHNQFGNAIIIITLGSDQAKIVEGAALATTAANITVATNFVVKSACGKAIGEVEKRLESAYMARKLSGEDNRLFFGDQEISTMIEKVPKSIRMQSGSVSEESLRIYDNFSSKNCGLKVLSSEDCFLEFARKGPSTSEANTLNQAIKTPLLGYTSFMSNTEVTIPNTPIPPGRMSSISTSQLPPNIMQHGMLLSDRLATAASLQRIGTVDDNLHTTMPNLQAPTTYSARKTRITDQNLQEKVETILQEWINICYTPMAQRDHQHALACIVQMMHEPEVLSTDETITKFFKVFADIYFDVSYRLKKNDNSNQQSIVICQSCYFTLDAFSRLTCLMVKYSDGTRHTTKMNLLKKVLITSALQKDYETRGTEFNGMPFHRILIIMFNEPTVAYSVLEPMLWNIFETFGHTLFVLQFRKVPGFVYHWLDIIGHRNFIGKLLADNEHDTRSGAMYTRLIICHLKFLGQFLQNVQLSKSIVLVYNADTFPISISGRTEQSTNSSKFPQSLLSIVAYSFYYQTNSIQHISIDVDLCFEFNVIEKVLKKVLKMKLQNSVLHYTTGFVESNNLPKGEFLYDECFNDKICSNGFLERMGSSKNLSFDASVSHTSCASRSPIYGALVAFLILLMLPLTEAGNSTMSTTTTDNSFVNVVKGIWQLIIETLANHGVFALGLIALMIIVSCCFCPQFWQTTFHNIQRFLQCLCTRENDNDADADAAPSVRYHSNDQESEANFNRLAVFDA